MGASCVHVAVPGLFVWLIVHNLVRTRHACDGVGVSDCLDPDERTLR